MKVEKEFILDTHLFRSLGICLSWEWKVCHNYSWYDGTLQFWKKYTLNKDSQEILAANTVQYWIWTLNIGLYWYWTRLANYGPWAKSGPLTVLCMVCELRIFFFIFKWLKKNQKSSISWHVESIWNPNFSIHKLEHTHLFTYCL